MIVIVGGMPRSGSTFSFNIVRELLLARGTVAWASDNVLPQPQVLEATEHFILKSHHPDPELLELMGSGAAKCICTYRRPEDAVASWSDTFGFSLVDSIATVRAWIQWHRVQHGSLDIDFRAIESDALGCTLDIQRYLLGAEEAIEARRLAQAYDKAAVFERVNHMEKTSRTVDLGFSYYDPESFFHRRHVRSLDEAKAVHSLTVDELEAVRESFREFVDDEGFYRPPPR